jgi:hypothetical protein
MYAVGVELNDSNDSLALHNSRCPTRPACYPKILPYVKKRICRLVAGHKL